MTNATITQEDIRGDANTERLMLTQLLAEGADQDWKAAAIKHKTALGQQITRCIELKTVINTLRRLLEEKTAQSYRTYLAPEGAKIIEAHMAQFEKYKITLDGQEVKDVTAIIRQEQ